MKTPKPENSCELGSAVNSSVSGRGNGTGGDERNRLYEARCVTARNFKITIVVIVLLIVAKVVERLIYG